MSLMGEQVETEMHIFSSPLSGYLLGEDGVGSRVTA